jgi:sensor c-di-GMP phosphodiesterase-like protein
MVSFANDDDFILFHVPEPDAPVPTDEEITDLTVRLHQFIATRVEEQHGESVACAVRYVRRTGAHLLRSEDSSRAADLSRNSEAAASSVSVEQRELARKSADLRETLRTGALYIDYHPIVVAETQEIFGYEALARGTMRSMRRPEVMFEVAAQSDMIWELSRLCRNTAILGMKERLTKGQLLFINVDPHDFTDPAFTEMDLDVPDPSRVVLEITERTAIKDYPKFRGRLKDFRERGYRFAVDDAGQRIRRVLGRSPTSSPISSSSISR